MGAHSNLTGRSFAILFVAPFALSHLAPLPRKDFHPFQHEVLNHLCSRIK
jgi:hypothetical protein